MKMNILSRTTSERGSALLLCLIILVVITGISGAYMAFSLINSKKTNDDMFALQSLYIAEAAAGIYIEGLNNGTTLQVIQTPVDLAGGFYTVPVVLNYGSDNVDNDNDGTVDNSFEQNFYRIEVEGTYTNITRRLEIVLSRTAGGAFWNAIFAGNSAGDPNYDFYLGGSNKNQFDLIQGDIYTGGGLTTEGYAQLLNENGGTSPQATAMYADSYSDNSGTNIDPNFVQGNQSALYIEPGQNDPTISLYEEKALAGASGYVDVSGDLETLGASGYGVGGKALGEAEKQILDRDVPAHMWRLNPATNGFSVGTSGKDRTVDYGNVDTAKDDYYLEDPTSSYKDLTMNSSVNGTKQAHVNYLSAPSTPYPDGGNNQVYFIDGNMWASHNGILNFKFKKPDPNEAMAVTVVVQGNINFTDNLLYDDSSMDGIALIAIEDPAYPNVTGSIFNDEDNKLPNGMTVEDFLDVVDQNNPSINLDPEDNPADRGRAAQEYNRANGSGNVFYGDPASGTVDYFEGFMYAQNNFYATGISVTNNKTSRVHIFGNMTAGNHVALERNTTNGYKALEVILDTKIKNGTLNLPDLPTTPGSGSGAWFIASWKQIP